MKASTTQSTLPYSQQTGNSQVRSHQFVGWVSKVSLLPGIALATRGGKLTPPFWPFWFANLRQNLAPMTHFFPEDQASAYLTPRIIAAVADGRPSSRTRVPLYQILPRG